MRTKSSAATVSKLRWGILGAAQIARKNWKAILNSRSGIIRAVASRDPARARQFIDNCQGRAPFRTAPEALGSYEQLLAMPDIDAVYIPLPTGLRAEWVIRAAKAGKHVLCEKPCARNAGELERMLEACRRNRVQFLDDVMFMHSRRLQRLRQVLDDGTSVGSIQRIASNFTFCAGAEFQRNDIRMDSRLEPHGCLGDLGWYSIRFALWAMNWKKPRQVDGRILQEARSAKSPAPVPTAFSGELLFDGGASAGFYCSFVTENQEWVHVSGTRGSLVVPDFVLPYHGDRVGFETFHPTFEVDGCDFKLSENRRRILVRERSHSHPSAQESNLFRNFARQAKSGRLNAEWPAWALMTQQVLDDCIASARRKLRRTR